MDFLNNSYQLLRLQSPDQLKWVLTYNGFYITAWTIEKRPSRMALIKVIRCWEQWNDCVVDYYDALGEGTPPKFKTYFPSGAELGAQVHSYYEDLYAPVTGDDPF